MTEHFLNTLGVCAHDEHERGAGVPEVMEADIRKPGTYKERFEGAGDEVVAADGRADPRREYQVAISPEFDKLLALFHLAFAVFLEGFHGLGGKLHGTTAFRRLGSAEDGFAVFDAREGALYAQDAMIEVYVLPLEA